MDPHLRSGRLKDKIGGFMNGNSKDELPLYKDKPRFPAGRRANGIGKFLPTDRRKRWALLGLIVVSFVWYTGVFPFSKTTREGDDVLFSESRQSWWSWLVGQDIDWNHRRNEVRQAFVLSWEDYAKHAWGMDEYSPISKQGMMLLSPGNSGRRGSAPMGWIIVDALDTAMMMNLTSHVAQARQWIASSLDFSKADGEISTFETTIRVLGGLLSAHYLSTQFPTLAAQKDDDVGEKGEDLYIEKAVDLADRILGAFDTPSGIPFSHFNPNISTGLPAQGTYGVTSIAEAATLQLEFKYLAKLTGEPMYWQKAEDIMRVVAANRQEDGLVPIEIDCVNGNFTGEHIGLGARGDSYYEYLIKQFLQTSKRESVYEEMWDEALGGIKKHLISFSETANFTVIGERPRGLNESGILTGRMDHLVCYLPGAIALGVTGGETVTQAKRRMGRSWGRKQEENLVLAEELMKTCQGMYAVTPSGLAAEVTHMILDGDNAVDGSSIFDNDSENVVTDHMSVDQTNRKPQTRSTNTGPRRWQGHQDPNWRQPRSKVNFDTKQPTHNPGLETKGLDWKRDFNIRPGDAYNLQRPEFVESLFYMYRITEDVKYREWGWQIFQSFMEHTAVRDQHGRVTGYTSTNSVMNKSPGSVSSSSPMSSSQTLGDVKKSSSTQPRKGEKVVAPVRRREDEDEKEKEYASFPRLSKKPVQQNSNNDDDDDQRQQEEHDNHLQMPPHTINKFRQHQRRDSMEGFWLAETLKYFYLLFSDPTQIPDEWFDLSRVVINTEAHFFPRFDIQDHKVLKTGWSLDDTKLPTVEEILRQRKLVLDQELEIERKAMEGDDHHPE